MSRSTTGAGAIWQLNAQVIASEVLGDPIMANILLMGYAWQKGLVPVGLPAMMRAIELNNVSIEMNKRAFTLGRLVAADKAALEHLTKPAARVIQFTAPASLEDMLAFRAAWLAKYQDAAYAKRYVQAVRKVERKERETDGAGSKTPLTKAVARYLFKVMAFKDEYEVARLHADPAFQAQISAQFEGDYKLEFHLAAPLVSKKRPGTDIRAKRRFGGWMLSAFRLLAPLKLVRDTPFDLFGYTEERRRERALRRDYFGSIDIIVARLTPENRDIALKIAQLPDKIRGYGHVKLASMDNAEAEARELMVQLTTPQAFIKIERA